MTAEQEQHLQEVKTQFLNIVDPKYRKGQAEHGGDMKDMSMEKLLHAAIEEAVDQVVYLLTLREVMRKNNA